MKSDDLEFQISQYLDGTLSSAQIIALEKRLAEDGGARELLGEYQKLQAHLGSAMPPPVMQWDRLEKRLSSAVKESREPMIAGRIGWRPRLAVAAGILIVLGVGLLIHDEPDTQRENVQSVAVVTGPQAEAPSGPVSVEIAVGPSAALAARAASWRYAEGVVTRPSHVELAGGIRTPADGDPIIH
jgi:anti-sigma factor RsiW